MPKKVDPIARKNQIAEAAWQVILDKGIDKASIQSIAAEANMSVGLVQHNFSSKKQLLHYAMQLVLERMEERALNRLSRFSGTEEEKLRRLMTFLIPVTHEELTEARVWMAFLGNYFNDPMFKTLRQAMDRYSRKIMAMILELMKKLGYLPANVQHDLELEVLYAFIDGLVVHALQSPDMYHEEKIDRCIEYYLNGKKEGK